METMTPHQGVVAGALWCKGAGHDPCRAPCGMVAPAEAISKCCAVGSAHFVGTESKPLGICSVSPRSAGCVAVKAFRLIKDVYASDVCVFRRLQRSERAA